MWPVRYWAEIEVPISSPQQRERWSCGVVDQIDSRLEGRWGATRLLGGRVRTTFAVEDISRQTKDMVIAFARAEAEFLGIDLGESAATARIIPDSMVRESEMPSGE